MLTQGEVLARIKKCTLCPYRYTRHASFERWPRCWGGYDRPQGIGLDTQVTSEFMNDEASICPQGSWDNLVPVDITAVNLAKETDAIAGETAKLKRIIDILSPDETSATEIRAKIEALYKDNLIRFPETAAALEGHVDVRSS